MKFEIKNPKSLKALQISKKFKERCLYRGICILKCEKGS